MSVEDFRAAMASAGIHIVGDIIEDGVLHRADAPGRAKRKDCWYIYHPAENDAPAAGAAGNWQLGISDTWCAKSTKRMTKAEKQAFAARVSQMKAETEAEQARVHEMTAAAAKSVWDQCRAVDDHPYAERKRVPLGHARIAPEDIEYTCADIAKPKRIVRKGSLVIPLLDQNRKLWSLQTIDDAGKKLFLWGGKKRGNYFAVGSVTDTIVICEGWATAVTCNLATGYHTVIAFDAGNLWHVAEIIRAKHPGKAIIIAADNDHKTTGNPGRTAAKAAAEHINALVVWPVCDGTDFNDLACERGMEAVQAAFMAPVAPDDDPIVEPEPVLADTVTPSTETIDHPVPLGFDNGDYFYLGMGTSQISKLRADSHTKLALISLAPLNYWEMNYPNSDGGVDWLAAANYLMRSCEARVFSPEIVMGRGAMMDKGRVVYHMGERILVDGVDVGRIVPNSRNIYPRALDMEIAECAPLSNRDARAFVELIGMLPWNSSDMAALLAGWIVTAPFCGASRWRTHCSVSGPRGSGKSWAINNIVKATLRGISVNVEGSTTEPGIRSKLRSDARPVVFDESETQTDADRVRMQAVLNLARISSSEAGGEISKGTSGGGSITYRIRSCFLWGSINNIASQAADMSRTIVCSLEGPPEGMTDEDKENRSADFRAIERACGRLITEDFGHRLFWRTLPLVKTIRNNADVLANAIAERTGDRRLGDTIAAPLAGWWSLYSSEMLTEERARKVIEEQGWTLGVAERSKTEADHDQALAHLLETVVRVNSSVEDNIGNMVGKAEYDEALRIRGIAYCDGMMCIARRHSKVAEMFKGTAWAASWETVLEQHPGCVKIRKRISFGGVQRAAIGFVM